MASSKAAASPRTGRQRKAGHAADTGLAGQPATSIVGIGASAGGLEAFEQFLRVMPVDSGLGLVLVQHLDPSHDSLLVDILQRATTMPVVQAADQMPVLPDRVHVIPPNRDLAIRHGVLNVTLPVAPHGLRMPIDAFLRSLAEDQGDAAAGIVLSGTGTDGTLGLRAIFGAGGLCLVQSPANAKYGGMPASAISAGYANQVLDVEKIPQALIDGVRFGFGKVVGEAAGHAPVTSGLNRVIAQLRSTTGHDFSQYKQSTVSRRIERRMAMHHLDDMGAFAQYASEHPDELQALFRELLINVTSFFRDPDAFVTLKHKVLPDLLKNKSDGHALRIWVAGCATGEEVYSVAMIVQEWMDETARSLKVQLYGTDLDDEAIKVARAGIYPPNIAQDVLPERLQRFFDKIDTGYRIKKTIRDMAIFAVQSIIKDPPFTQLDLLSCRNVLIYLKPNLQERLIPTFHYALRPGGVLFLSPSESIGDYADLFETIDRKWKFYMARPTPESKRKMLSDKFSWVSEGVGQALQARPDPSGERHIADLTRRALLQSFAPAAVVTDIAGNILYVHGDTAPFLRPAPGHPTHNVIDMACDGLQLELRDALRQAASRGVLISNQATLLTSAGEHLPVNIAVRPMADPEAALKLLLVSFQQSGGTLPARPVHKSRRSASAQALRCEELERELADAKESIRAGLQEQQLINEELRSANEELQSANEELQSTNEELETSKEELQSINEELVTVNAELHTKIEQMATIQDDMRNLLENIRVGTIFLDRHLVIRRFTLDATKVYPLKDSDVGRPLSDMRSALLDCDLLADAQVVLDSLVLTEREARTARGVWYLARVQPYRTADNIVDGVVLTFTDITERINAMAAQEARQLAEAIVDAVGSPLVVLDTTCHVISANQAFHARFGGDSRSTVGRTLYEIHDRHWDRPEIRQLLGAPWTPAATVQHRSVEIELEGAATPEHVRLDARLIASHKGAQGLTLLSILPGEPAAQVSQASQVSQPT